MKKTVFTPLYFFAATTVLAQKIQYSRQTFPSPFADAVQVVANVAGYHHVLCFTANKKPLIYVTDAALQSFVKKEVDTKLKENCDVRTISFNDCYLLYLHVPGAALHQLFRIAANGDVQDVSQTLSRSADSTWNRNTATLELFNQDNRLAVVSHTYYDALKKIGSRVATFDSSLATNRLATVFFPFDKYADKLQQSILFGPALLVLKTSGSAEKGNSLDVIKVDLFSNKTVSNSFNSGSQLYVNPAFYANATDSSLLVYSLLREGTPTLRLRPTALLATLDASLREKIPAVLLKAPFRGNTAGSFLLAGGNAPHWLTAQNIVRVRRAGSRFATPPALEAFDPQGLNIAAAQNYSYESNVEFNAPAGVRFTVLNERFKTVKDSVAENKGSIYDVQPRPSGQFIIGKKACLLLIENFTASKHGLLLFSNGKDGGLSTVHLSVFDRYDYLLPQVQATDDYFLLPYSYKNEIGLVKITPGD